MERNTRPLRRSTAKLRTDQNGRSTIAVPPGVDLQAMVIKTGEEAHTPANDMALSGSERGIIISPDRWEWHENERIMQYSISPERLNKHLLLWDKILCTVSTFSAGRGQLDSPGLEILESESVLKKVFWNSIGAWDDPIAAVQHAQQMQFVLDANANWVLGPCGPEYSPSLPSGLTQAPDIELQLYNALEMPSRAVHVERILEFRRRNQAELQQLRWALTKARDQVLNSQTPKTSLSLALNDIKRAIDDLNQVSRESFRERVTQSISVSLNAKTFFESGKSGYITYGITGDILLAALATIVDFGSSVFQVSPTIGKRPRLPAHCRDYQYVFLAHQLVASRTKS